jgi:pimeloyl-ACP methyl ester carboxylesterase
MAEDVAVLIAELGVGQVDVMGYSMGGSTAVQIAIRHPELVRKLVVVSAGKNREANYEVVWQGLGALTMDIFEGTPFYDSYRRVAPDPDAFRELLAKMDQHDVDFVGVPTDAIREITVPTLLMFGDSDIVRLAHVVEMFKLLGDGVPGDFVGMPNAQLAILPGAGHLGVVMQQAEWLTEIAVAFSRRDSPDAAARTLILVLRRN